MIESINHSVLAHYQQTLFCCYIVLLHLVQPNRNIHRSQLFHLRREHLAQCRTSTTICVIHSLLSCVHVLNEGKSGLILSYDIFPLLNSPVFMFFSNILVSWYSYSLLMSLTSGCLVETKLFKPNSLSFRLIERLELVLLPIFNIFVCSKVDFLRLEFTNRFRDFRIESFGIDFRSHVLLEVVGCTTYFQHLLLRSLYNIC